MQTMLFGLKCLKQLCTIWSSHLYAGLMVSSLLLHPVEAASLFEVMPEVLYNRLVPFCAGCIVFLYYE